MQTIINESVYFIEAILLFLSYYFLMDYKFSKEKNSKNKPIITAIAYVVIINLIFRLIQLFSSSVLNNLFIPIVLDSIISVFSTFMFFDGKLSRRIGGWFIYFLPAIIAEGVVLPIVISTLKINKIFNISSINDLFNNELSKAICIVIEAQIIVCIWFAIVLAMKVFIDKSWPKHYLFFLMFPMYEALMFVMFYRNANELSRRIVWQGYCFFVFGFVIDCVLTYLVYGISKEKALATRMADLELERQSETVYRALVAENLEQMKMMRHDIKNQLEVVCAGIANGMSKDEANSIIRDINNAVNAQTSKKYCDNNIVNVILGIKLKEANDKNIKSDVRCVIPDNIAISSIDLCSVFNNILDNAIEANDRIEDEKKFISINCGVTNDYLTIKVTNPCYETIKIKQGYIPTTKKNKKDHGIGLKRVKQVVNEYDGEIVINCDNNIFEIIVGIKVEKNV